MHKERIMMPKLRDKVMTAEEAASLSKPGMTLGASGFTAVGYPKAVPKAVAARGEAHSLRVVAGASCGDEMDGALARANPMACRAPVNVNADTRRQIHEGAIKY